MVIFILYFILCGARGRVVIGALNYELEGPEFESRPGDWIFSVYLILPAVLGPRVYSASNRNVYQKQKKNHDSAE
jgi:hypothetical protein